MAAPHSAISSSRARPRTSDSEPPTNPAKIEKNTDEPMMKPIRPGRRPTSVRRNTARNGVVTELARLMMPAPVISIRASAGNGAAVVAGVIALSGPFPVPPWHRASRSRGVVLGRTT
jgi:hypothetical protein